MKQTAVEWLVEQLLIYGDKAFNREITLGQYHIKKQELIEQAKEMHRQEIIRAGADHCYPTEEIAIQDAEQYYNKTFKSE